MKSCLVADSHNNNDYNSRSNSVNSMSSMDTKPVHKSIPFLNRGNRRGSDNQANEKDDNFGIPEIGEKYCEQTLGNQSNNRIVPSSSSSSLPPTPTPPTPTPPPKLVDTKEKGEIPYSKYGAFVQSSGLHVNDSPQAPSTTTTGIFHFHFHSSLLIL